MMSNKFVRLDTDDVIAVNTENFERLDVSKTLTASELIEAIKEYIGSDAQEANLFTGGMDAKVLRPGDGWKKGKIRICVEFFPDEPEIKEQSINNNSSEIPENSPLDDLREHLKNIS